MADTTYAQLDDLKGRLNIGKDDDVDNDMLQSMLNSAAQMVDRYTRGGLMGVEAFSATSAGTVRYFDDVLTQDGYLEIDDCLAVTAITRGGSTISSGFYKLWPYNVVANTQPYTRIYLNAAALPGLFMGGLGTWYGWPQPNVGLGQYAVTGTWGYCTQANRPSIVKEATLSLAVMRYEVQNLSSKDLLQALASPTTAKMKLIKEDLDTLKNQGALFA